MIVIRAREMDDSEVNNTDCSSKKSPEFKSLQPQVGSWPSIMGSGDLFWHACVHAGKNYLINKP